MTNKSDLNNFEPEINEEINLNNILRKFRRNIVLILSITSFSTIYSIIYASNLKPIYSGQFQILVREDLEKEDAAMGLVNLPKRFRVNSGAKRTQSLILQSPLVLNPVYQFARKEYARRDEDISKLTYKKWIRNNLKLTFIDNSDVFDITFRDTDKDLILSTLSMISEKYKKYSKRDFNKNLTKEFNYLKGQEKIYLQKYEESFKKHNKFFIENNLFDKAAPTSAPSISPNPFAINANQKKQEDRNLDQFSLLDNYELQRTKYSLTLKPNSELIKNLDSKIIKLKKLTKKPTSILYEKNVLTKTLLRDEATLENIQNQIRLNQLKSANQKDPWELISIPTVDEQKVGPNKKNIVITYFLASLFIALISALIIESLKGSIDDLNLIKSKINAKFVTSIPSNTSNVNLKILDLNIINVLKEKTYKNPSKNFGIYSERNSSLISDYMNLNKDATLINIKEMEIINDVQNIFFFLESGKITIDTIKQLNTYIELYPDKSFYWINLENEKIL